MIRWDWIIIPPSIGFCTIFFYNSFWVGFIVTLLMGTIVRHIVEDQ
jgi:hypothetical protein